MQASKNHFVNFVEIKSSGKDKKGKNQMDLIKKVVELEDDLIFAMRQCDFDFNNMDRTDLKLLYDCLGTLEMNSEAFRKKITERLEYMDKHGYSKSSKEEFNA